MRSPRRTRHLLGVAALSLAMTAAVAPPHRAEAEADGATGNIAIANVAATRAFERIATFPVFHNADDRTEATVAEIVDATDDGATLVYTDALRQVVGFVDISEPAAPRADGVVPVDGSPTSVATLGGLALVAVNTSEFTAPSGSLVVVDIGSRNVVHAIELAGQPDSVKVSPDGRYLAIAIENERDEDVAEGELPQAPAGLLQVVDLEGEPATWTVRDVDLTGLADYAPDDPEPEFVDVNAANRAVVSLQENNHVAIVDLETATVVADFTAGTVTLDGVDATEDGVISLTETIADVPREPDAVAWLPGDLIATANEGDLFGGSRGFSIFDPSGAVVYDSRTSFEELAVRHGHYPESRSDAKGTEPEGIAYGRYDDEDLLFVGSERGSFVAVYALGDDAQPVFRQLLPTGLGPEGLLAIPERDLFVVTSEEDDPELGVRATITIYELRDGAPSYPDIVSGDDADGRPIVWGALSALASDPNDPHTLYAVSDSYYAKTRIFTIDVGARPAVITSSIVVKGADHLDAEGIQLAPDGTFWIASEGDADDKRPNRLLQVAPDGTVLAEVGLPAEVLACRAASENRGSLGSGFEGLAIVPGIGRYTLAVAQQRGWDYTTPACEHLDDDPSAANEGEPRYTRIWFYDPQTGAWDHLAYELDEKPAEAAWIGLSEIVATPSGWYAVIERDNRTGELAATKSLAKFDLRHQPDGVVSRDEKHRIDLLASLRATNGWITDKPEGFTVAPDGQMYVVTDNDGVDGWTGETQLLRLGDFHHVFFG